MTALFAYRSIDDDDHHHDDAGGSSSSSSSLDCAISNPSTACSTITDALLHRPRKTTANTSTKIPGTPTTVRCYSEEEEEEYLYSDNLHEEFFVPSIDDSPPPVARGAILRPVLRDPFPVVDADADADANISHATNPTSTIRLHRTAPPLLPVFPTRARGPVLTGSQSNKEDSVNRTDNDDNDNDDDAWIRNNSGNTININNTNDDDTSKTICTSYYAKQRSRKQIRKLYRTTSSSNSKNNTEGGRSSSVHRKLSMTRVKDAWNTLVADRSSQSSTPASSPSGNGRRSFLPSYRSSRFYHYLRDEVETKAKTKTKTKTKSDRPRTRQHESVEPPSMPSLSSPTDGKNQNHHHNGNHHHTADGVPLSSAATTTTTTKTRWNQLVDGFRKEPSLSSLSAAVLLSSSATATSTNTNTNTTPSNSINININTSDCCYQSATLDPSTASAHTTCTETTDSNTCITAPGSRPSSPRLVALLQKGLYRCRNDEDEDDDDDEDEDDDEGEGEGEDEGGEDNDHPAAGSFAFAIGRGEF